jgi:transposase-like protein
MIKLMKVIERRIYPGTTIMSDKWKSYDGLKNHGYTHFSVNHSKNFVDPKNPEVHTQTIESRWCAIKRKLKKKGTNVTKFLDEYLLEYCYKKKFENRVFEQMLIDIKNKYKLK